MQLLAMNKWCSKIESDPEETDTQVILYYLYGEKKSHRNVIVLNSDSDLFLIRLN